MTFPNSYLRIYLFAAPCLFIGALASLGMYNTYASVFALLCFCVLMVLLINLKSSSSILLPTFFGFLWLSASVLYLETGAYAPEIAVQTTANGSAGRLISLLTIFLLTCFFMLPRNRKLDHRNTQRLEVAVFYFYVLLLILFVLNGAVFGFPIIHLEQRFFYWERHPIGSLLSKLLSLSGYLFLFVGWRMGCSYAPHSRFVFKLKTWKLILFSFIIVGLLYSNKASYFLSVMLYLLAGYLIAKGGRREQVNLLRIIPAKTLIFSILLIVTVTLFSYRYIHGYIGGDLINQLLARLFAMQGQLWWAIDNQTPDNTVNFLDMLFKDDNGGPYGIYLMMQGVMPASSFGFYFDNRIPLTGGFPASLSFYFSYPMVALFLIAFGVVFGVIYSGSVIALTKGRYELFVWVVLLSSLSWLTSLGSLNIFTSIIFWGASLVLLILNVARKLQCYTRLPL